MGLNDCSNLPYDVTEMSLAPIIFFLAGRLCCRANLFSRLVSRHEADLFQAY